MINFEFLFIYLFTFNTLVFMLLWMCIIFIFFFTSHHGHVCFTWNVVQVLLWKFISMLYLSDWPWQLYNELKYMKWIISRTVNMTFTVELNEQPKQYQNFSGFFLFFFGNLSLTFLAELPIRLFTSARFTSDQLMSPPVPVFKQSSLHFLGFPYYSLYFSKVSPRIRPRVI